MKKKDLDQIHAMTAGEIQKEIRDLAKKASDKTIAKKDSNARNVRDGKALRIKRAILLTVLREKELQS